MIRAGAVALLLGGLTGIALFGTSLGRTADGPPVAEAAAVAVDPAAPGSFGAAPELVPIDGWLPTSVGSFPELLGPVTVVHFWSHDCEPCRASIAELRPLVEEFGPSGLRGVAVHTPGPGASSDPAVITQAAVDQGITWPIALDSDHTAFDRWQRNRRFWPRVFVVDGSGQIRFDHIGAGGGDELRSTVVWLLEHGA